MVRDKFSRIPQMTLLPGVSEKICNYGRWLHRGQVDFDIFKTRNPWLHSTWTAIPGLPRLAVTHFRLRLLLRIFAKLVPSRNANSPGFLPENTGNSRRLRSFVRAFSRCYPMVVAPPSQGITTPVKNEPALDERKIVKPAASSMAPQRPMVKLSMTCFSICSVA